MFERGDGECRPVFMKCKSKILSLNEFPELRLINLKKVTIKGTAMADILKVAGLTKHYGKLCALNNIHFNVPKGSVFGLLGPNGSGKTTFLGIIMDVLKSDGGTFQWFENGVRAAGDRKKIGTLLETPNFYPYLSAVDNLLINTRTKECAPADIDRVLQLLNLYERRKSAFKTYSLGMKQRLAISAALLGNPEIVVLDEPTNGLDPLGIADIRKLIIQMGREGKTVIIASHLLDEIEKVCTHVAIIKKGNLLATGPVEEVLSSEDIYEVGADDNRMLEKVLKAHAGIKSLQANADDSLNITLNPELTPAAINRYCFEQNIVLSKLNRKKKSLELKFLEITKEKK